MPWSRDVGFLTEFRVLLVKNQDLESLTYEESLNSSARLSKERTWLYTTLPTCHLLKLGLCTPHPRYAEALTPSLWE